MVKIRVTKEFSFDCAHALSNYVGNCRNIHGHTYTLLVTLIGTVNSSKGQQEEGMIIDFSVLKNIINEHIISKFDHSLILSSDHPGKEMFSDFQDEGKLIIFDGRTTCENMVVYFADVISNVLPESVSLFSLRLYETPTSFSEWFASDNQ